MKADRHHEHSKPHIHLRRRHLSSSFNYIENWSKRNPRQWLNHDFHNKTANCVIQSSCTSRLFANQIYSFTSYGVITLTSKQQLFQEKCTDTGAGSKQLRALMAAVNPTKQRPKPSLNNEVQGCKVRLISHVLHGEESSTCTQIFSFHSGLFVSSPLQII